MTTRVCDQCKAPLPQGGPGEAVRCPFCGAQHEDEALRRVKERLGVSGGPPPSRSFFPFIWVVVIAAVLAVAITGFVLARREPERAPAPAATPVAVAPEPPPPQKDERLPLCELGRADLAAYRELLAPPPPTAFAKFDALASLPWATEIARAWSPDAVFWDLELHGLRTDGTADLTARDDFEATYQFASPARRAAAIQLGAVSEKGVPTDLNVEVKASKVRAESLSPQVSYLVETAKRPPLAPECPLARAVAAALAAGALPQPFRTAEASYKDALGWVWVFDMDHDRPVRVTDCTAPKAKAAKKR
jgi:hypothetical protein